MTTNNTQAELRDELAFKLEIFLKCYKDDGNHPWNDKTCMTKSQFLDEVVAHTNKQIEEVLDRLESMAAYDPSGSSPVINPRQIEAERNKLNPSNSTPFNKLKEYK